MDAKVIALPPRTYTAKAYRAHVSGLDVIIAGTLDGFLDFSVLPLSGENATYSLTCDDARVLAAHLLSAVADVQQNCLYELDALLAPDPA